MRLIRMFIALACMAAGIVVGALNPQPVDIDLGFSHASTTVGVAVLLALLLGVVIGGLVLMASVVLPLHARLRRSDTHRGSAAPPDGT